MIHKSTGLNEVMPRLPTDELQQALFIHIPRSEFWRNNLVWMEARCLDWRKVMDEGQACGGIIISLTLVEG